MTLPHGTGKQVRVLVFAAGEAERIALEAGADYAGIDELVQQIKAVGLSSMPRSPWRTRWARSVAWAGYSVAVV